MSIPRNRATSDNPSEAMTSRYSLLENNFHDAWICPCSCLRNSYSVQVAYSTLPVTLFTTVTALSPPLMMQIEASVPLCRIAARLNVALCWYFCSKNPVDQIEPFFLPFRNTLSATSSLVSRAGRSMPANAFVLSDNAKNECFRLSSRQSPLPYPLFILSRPVTIRAPHSFS